MSIGIVSIGSSSSGNSYIVSDGKTRLLLDVGLSGKRIREGLAARSLSPGDIRGILVTHEHVDHVKSIRMMARECGDARVYTSRGTAGGCPNFEYVSKDRLALVSSQEIFNIGSIQVKAFSLSHDAAEPLSYSFKSGGRQLTVVTDTGVVTDEIFQEIRTADVLVLEANHEVNLLEMGPYPYSVKRRILGDHGHLSNETAGRTLSSMLEERGGREMPKILLAHLSSQNNTPLQAKMTVCDVLNENSFAEDRDYLMGIAGKDRISGPVQA